MQQMYWDDELAKGAQEWANNCNYAHNTYKDRKVDRFQVGQNIAITMMDYGSSNVERIDFNKSINNWFDEHKTYTFGKNQNHKSGHYTQIIWADTYLIGCGYIRFSKPNSVINKFYVCNYGPAGNDMDETPYKTGQISCGAKLKISTEYPGLCSVKDPVINQCTSSESESIKKINKETPGEQFVNKKSKNDIYQNTEKNVYANTNKNYNNEKSKTRKNNANVLSDVTSPRQFKQVNFIMWGKNNGKQFGQKRLWKTHNGKKIFGWSDNSKVYGYSDGENNINKYLIINGSGRNRKNGSWKKTGTQYMVLSGGRKSSGGGIGIVKGLKGMYGEQWKTHKHTLKTNKKGLSRKSKTYGYSDMGNNINKYLIMNGSGRKRKNDRWKKTTTQYMIIHRGSKDGRRGIDTLKGLKGIYGQQWETHKHRHSKTNKNIYPITGWSGNSKTYSYSALGNNINEYLLSNDKNRNGSHEYWKNTKDYILTNKGKNDLGNSNTKYRKTKWLYSKIDEDASDTQNMKTKEILNTTEKSDEDVILSENNENDKSKIFNNTASKIIILNKGKNDIIGETETKNSITDEDDPHTQIQHSEIKEISNSTENTIDDFMPSENIENKSGTRKSSTTQFIIKSEGRNGIIEDTKEKSRKTKLVTGKNDENDPGDQIENLEMKEILNSRENNIENTVSGEINENNKPGVLKSTISKTIITSHGKNGVVGESGKKNRKTKLMYNKIDENDQDTQIENLETKEISNSTENTNEDNVSGENNDNNKPGVLKSTISKTIITSHGRNGVIEETEGKNRKTKLLYSKTDDDSPNSPIQKMETKEISNTTENVTDDVISSENNENDSPGILKSTVSKTIVTSHGKNDGEYKGNNKKTKLVYSKIDENDQDTQIQNLETKEISNTTENVTDDVISSENNENDNPGILKSTVSKTIVTSHGRNGVIEETEGKNRKTKLLYSKTDEDSPNDQIQNLKTKEISKTTENDNDDVISSETDENDKRGVLKSSASKILFTNNGKNGVIGKSGEKTMKTKLLYSKIDENDQDTQNLETKEISNSTENTNENTASGEINENNKSGVSKSTISKTVITSHGKNDIIGESEGKIKKTKLMYSKIEENGKDGNLETNEISNLTENNEDDNNQGGKWKIYKRGRSKWKQNGSQKYGWNRNSKDYGYSGLEKHKNGHVILSENDGNGKNGYWKKTTTQYMIVGRGRKSGRGGIGMVNGLEGIYGEQWKTHKHRHLKTNKNGLSRKSKVYGYSGMENNINKYLIINGKGRNRKNGGWKKTTTQYMVVSNGRRSGLGGFGIANDLKDVHSKKWKSIKHEYLKPKKYISTVIVNRNFDVFDNAKIDPIKNLPTIVKSVLKTTNDKKESLKGQIKTPKFIDEKQVLNKIEKFNERDKLKAVNNSNSDNLNNKEEISTENSTSEIETTVRTEIETNKSIIDKFNVL